jgi:hypothetical protein
LTVAMFAAELAAIETAQAIRLAGEGGSPPVDEGVTR